MNGFDLTNVSYIYIGPKEANGVYYNDKRVWPMTYTYSYYSSIPQIEVIAGGIIGKANYTADSSTYEILSTSGPTVNCIDIDLNGIEIDNKKYYTFGQLLYKLKEMEQRITTLES